MTRTHLASLASIALTVVVVAACGGGGGGKSSSSSPPRPQPSGSGPMLTTGQTSIGQFVVDGSGRTLYLFAKDSGPRSTCSGSCAANWPPFTASATPKVGGGVPASAVTLIRRPDGSRQVALDGHPLYRFTGDQSAGQLNGQGVDAFGAKWFVVSPAGTKITAGAPPPRGY